MGQIYVIINFRFRKQLEDGPADCYLAALCLDPRVSFTLRPWRVLIFISCGTGYVRSAILYNPLSLKIKIPHIASAAVPDILASLTYVYPSSQVPQNCHWSRVQVPTQPRSQGQNGHFCSWSFCAPIWTLCETWRTVSFWFNDGCWSGCPLYWTQLTKIPEGSVLAVSFSQSILTIPNYVLSPVCHRKTLFNQAFVCARRMDNVSIHEDEYASQEPSTSSDTGRHDSDSTMAYVRSEG